MSKIIINATKRSVSISAEGAVSLILGGGLVVIGFVAAYRYLI